MISRTLILFSLLISNVSFGLSELEKKVLVLKAFKGTSHECFNNAAQVVFNDAEFLFDAIDISRDLKVQNFSLLHEKRAIINLILETSDENRKFLEFDFQFEFYIQKDTVVIRKKEIADAPVNVPGYKVILYGDPKDSRLKYSDGKTIISSRQFYLCVDGEISLFPKEEIDRTVALLEQRPGKGLKGLKTSLDTESTVSSMNLIGRLIEMIFY